MTTTNPIPSQLTDPNGPWLDPVLRAARIAALISSGGRGYAVVWVPVSYTHLDVYKRQPCGCR